MLRLWHGLLDIIIYFWNLQFLNNVIINKTKVLLPQAILFRHFGFIVPKALNYLGFQSFHFERTWWRLFWAYLMKAILSVPDEGYSERTWWRLFWAYLMKAILSVPDEGYSERTWWRLFWAYMMKAILGVPDEGRPRNASYALNKISMFSWYSNDCYQITTTVQAPLMFLCYILFWSSDGIRTQ